MVRAERLCMKPSRYARAISPLLAIMTVVRNDQAVDQSQTFQT